MDGSYQNNFTIDITIDRRSVKEEVVRELTELIDSLTKQY
jgi:hypothetical protein